MALTIHSTLTLHNSVPIPVLGLGVWQIRNGGPTLNACRHAIQCGYRHIDTARFYNNEEDVGRAVRQCGWPREALFVTTKLWNDDHGYDKAIRAFHESLKRLNLPYVDLYLIHWPETHARKESWKALETLYEEGLCKAIGVSNYTLRHLEEVFSYCRIKPMVNQVEFHPFLYQKSLLDFCRRHDVILEAYSPLTKGMRLKEPRLKNIAEKYRRSAAQILIRWALQQGVVVLPKSADPKRIEENAAVFDFEISNDDMEKLNHLNENWHCTWDPTDVP